MDSLDGRDAAPGRPPGLPIRRVEDSRDLSRGKVRYSSISKAGSVRSEADGVIFQPQKERRQAGGINVVHGEVGANDLHVGVRRVCHEAATPLGECEVHAALEIIGCKWRVRIQMHLERPVRRIDSLHSAAALQIGQNSPGSVRRALEKVQEVFTPEDPSALPLVKRIQLLDVVCFLGRFVRKGRDDRANFRESSTGISTP